ncbi:MutS protein msh4 [Ascosphaera aggregata]|nr:MutS protein msh4 [Ascosphaera aggregata]
MPVVDDSLDASTFGARSPSTSLDTGRSYPARLRTGRTVGTSVNATEIICAISESRGISPTVGLAFVNVTTSEVVLCQICDSQTYARTVQKLAVFDPVEILFMRTAADPKSKLYSIVEDNLPQMIITPCERRLWAEATGHEYIDDLAFKEDLESIKLSLEGNYFATCCLAAALKYVELELCKRFAPYSLRIRYEPSEGSVMIDLNTIVSLELIQNLQVAKSRDCLFGLLNATMTAMGSRLLRSSVLQPSTDRSKLEARYDAVEELTTRPDMFTGIRTALKGFVDADKVLSSVSQFRNSLAACFLLIDQLIVIPTKITFQYAESSINNVIMLKTYISSIKPIYEALTGAKCPLLLALRNAGVNSLLDVARQTYKEANNDAVELAIRLGETHNMPIELKFETGRQYYFRLLIADIQSDELPDIFVNVFKKRKYLEFQTLDLVKLNQRITDAHNEVISMSDRSIQELIDNLRGGLPGLFRISEGIAVLDMLAAFAHLAMRHDYVRPELTDTLAIKAGRHPIQEKIHSTRYIPNDAYATQQSRFQIITGCNMSGKSTYIHSLALMTVMAQIGCFVSAQYASFPISHQLFARVSADNPSEANVSTFSAEMREMAFILRNIKPRSMVIVDELGRGTSTSDGLAIAIAIAEALIDSHALVWFTTHFRDLPRVLAERPGVVNLHLSAEIVPEESKMTMLYKIADGYVQEKHYGLQLAKLLPFPRRMVEIAQLVSEAISERNEAKKRTRKAIAFSKKRKLLLDLREKLIQASQGFMKEEDLAQWLQGLQDDFTMQMAALHQIIDEEDDNASNDFDCTDDTIQEKRSVEAPSADLVSEDEEMSDVEDQGDNPSSDLIC